MLFAQRLRSDGYLVDESVDGPQTLTAIDRCKPDVLLLDLKMPVMDGMAVLNELKDMRPEKKPRIIVISGYGSIPVAVRATRLGAMAFLEKPVTATEIRKAIIEALAEQVPIVCAPAHDADMYRGGYAAVLHRIREALRQVNFPLAETLLMRVDHLAEKDAAYFNLLGIYYESKRQWRSARKFFSRAVRADPAYHPPRENLKRLDDLTARGQTRKPPLYGDEPDEARAAVEPAQPSRT